MLSRHRVGNRPSSAEMSDCISRHGNDDVMSSFSQTSGHEIKEAKTTSFPQLSYNCTVHENYVKQTYHIVKTEHVIHSTKTLINNKSAILSHVIHYKTSQKNDTCSRLLQGKFNIQIIRVA